MIRVSVVTGSRSEYGLLRGVMREFKESPHFDLKVIATGSHFSSEYGFTYRRIQEDGFRVDARIAARFDTHSAMSLTSALGRWTAKFGEAFHRLNPEVVVVMGDRYELLAVGAAAIVSGIPIAHISGGEITEGAIDEQIRHAVTKMAHLHFVANKDYAANVRQMGEERWRICVSGEPGLDNIHGIEPMNRSELEGDLKLDLSVPTAVVTFHPVTLESSKMDKQVDEVLSAIDLAGLQYVITYPNADLGSGQIIDRLKRFAKQHPTRTRLVTSLGQRRYLSLLRHAAMMIGNSSSGLVEAPSFNLPVVDIGSRQQGRLRAANVINVRCTREDVLRGIRAALRYDRTGRCLNPYGDGRSSARVRRFMEKIFKTKTREQILKKRFVRFKA